MENKVTTEPFELATKHLIMPSHLNPNSSIFGGQLLAWLDLDLYVFVAEKVRCTTMVTVSMEKVYFKNPGYLGEIIEIHGAIKKLRRTSVTVSGMAEAVNPENDSRRTIIECEVTYVSVDKRGRPTPLPKAPVHT